VRLQEPLGNVEPVLVERDRGLDQARVQVSGGMRRHPSTLSLRAERSNPAAQTWIASSLRSSQ
jgi:hypothetical protein